MAVTPRNKPRYFQTRAREGGVEVGEEERFEDMKIMKIK
jgi:hypothetical protein